VPSSPSLASWHRMQLHYFLFHFYFWIRTRWFFLQVWLWLVVQETLLVKTLRTNVNFFLSFYLKKILNGLFKIRCGDDHYIISNLIKNNNIYIKVHYKKNNLNSFGSYELDIITLHALRILLNVGWVYFVFAVGVTVLLLMVLVCFGSCWWFS